MAEHLSPYQHCCPTGQPLQEGARVPRHQPQRARPCSDSQGPQPLRVPDHRCEPSASATKGPEWSIAFKTRTQLKLAGSASPMHADSHCLSQEYLEDISPTESRLFPEDPYKRALSRLWANHAALKICPQFFRILLAQVRKSSASRWSLLWVGRSHHQLQQLNVRSSPAGGWTGLRVQGTVLPSRRMRWPRLSGSWQLVQQKDQARSNRPARQLTARQDTILPWRLYTRGRHAACGNNGCVQRCTCCAARCQGAGALRTCRSNTGSGKQRPAV